jgi:hypothetical protein
MAKSVSENMSDIGRSVSDAAEKVGHSIAAGAEKAADFVTGGHSSKTEGVDRGVQAISSHMDVIASCGKKIGVVDGVEGNAIKLTRKDSPDHQHHFVPLSWVQRVDNHVHLIKNSKETEMGWKSTSSDCGCGQ